MQGGLRVIYDLIEFQAFPFSYSLRFEDRVTLVRGDSATGKTFLYQMLEDLRLTKEYEAIRLFNYKTDNFHSSLAKMQKSFIVIDNADTILNEEDRKFINFEHSNQYMLFLRNCDGLNLSVGSFMVLCEKGKQITLEREIKF